GVDGAFPRRNPGPALRIGGVRSARHSVAAFPSMRTPPIFTALRYVAAAMAWCALVGAPARGALRGDVNCDGNIDTQDMDVLVAEGAGEMALPPGCEGGDVNEDGAINSADVVALVPLIVPTVIPTATPTPRSGPRIVYAGVANADGTILSPVAVDADGTLTFQRPNGFGFQLVVEAVP